MVQLKYFGDDRDYFKYDLITAIVTQTSLRHYVFVPMLTEHRHDNEGNLQPKPRAGKRADLLSFIGSCQTKSLSHWGRWLAKHAASYETVEPVDEITFSNSSRGHYWAQFSRLIDRPNTLVFLDPDTGLALGRKTRIRQKDLAKYILDDEFKLLLSSLHPTSSLLIYQHLPRNMHKHIETLEMKLELAHQIANSLKVSAYREGDLAFVAISKCENVHGEIVRALTDYHASSEHVHKSMHTSLRNQRARLNLPS